MIKKLLVFSALAGFSFADVYATFEAKGVKEAALNLSASGVVERINVDVGSNVKKGETLLGLNDREERAALAAAHAVQTPMRRAAGQISVSAWCSASWRLCTAAKKL